MSELIAAVVGIVLTCTGALLFSNTMCHSKWELTAEEVSWGPIKGCLIKIHGKWVPSENYREVP